MSHTHTHTHTHNITNVGGRDWEDYGSRPAQANSETTYQPTSQIIATPEAGGRRITVQVSSRQKYKTLSKKQPKSQKGQRVAQVVEYLPSKYKTQSSHPNAAKKFN
jgi:hypothetical protein